MSEIQNKLLKDLNRLSYQIDSSKSTVGHEPLFRGIVSLMRGAQDFFNLKHNNYQTSEVLSSASSYDTKTKQFKEYLKNKNLSNKERDYLLYGN
jgi:hypothetical protein